MSDRAALKNQPTMPTSEATPAPPPAAPKIYHILHLDNLGSLLQHGGLYSDAEMLRRGILCTTIGMNKIKKRRLEELPVKCHPETNVGEYVPFYFCPRSIMLYLLNRGNSPDLDYKGGQRPIVHLESDLYETIQWAQEQDRKWAFTTSNAGAGYTSFYNDVSDLKEVDWAAVGANQWSSSLIKEGKQAEFLLHESFPWSLVRQIGVIDAATVTLVKSRMGRDASFPPVVAKPEWYY